MAQYSKVAHAFKKFFNAEELEKVLDQKVDKTKLLKVVQTKASKSDLDSAVELVKKLYARCRTLSIM